MSEQIVTTRPESLSTLQTLDLANGEILNGLLTVGGRSMLLNLEHPARFIDHLFISTLCRKPHDSERQLALNLLGESPTADIIQDLLWNPTRPRIWHVQSFFHGREKMRWCS